MEWPQYTAAVVFFPWGSMGSCSSRATHLKIFLFETFSLLHGTMGKESAVRQCTIPIQCLSHGSWHLLLNFTWIFCSRHNNPCLHPSPVSTPVKTASLSCLLRGKLALNVRDKQTSELVFWCSFKSDHHEPLLCFTNFTSVWSKTNETSFSVLISTLTCFCFSVFYQWNGFLLLRLLLFSNTAWSKKQQ